MFSGYQVYMEMWHINSDYRKSNKVSFHCFFEGLHEFFCFGEGVLKKVVGNILHPLVLFFGNEKSVSRRDGIDIKESKYLLVFVDDVCWNLSCNYLGKN